MAHLNESIELLRRKMRVQHLAWRSEESYVAWVRRYAAHVAEGRLPSLLLMAQTIG